MDLEQALTEHRPVMLAFAARYVQGDEAEDVVQNASLLAWQRFDTFKGNAPLLTWLLAIVRHQALSFLRLRERQTRSSSEGGPFLPLVDPSPVTFHALTDDERTWLEAWLRGEAPQSISTQYRKLRKIRQRLTDAPDV